MLLIDHLGERTRVWGERGEEKERERERESRVGKRCLPRNV
jgi:hypothetical protein